MMRHVLEPLREGPFARYFAAETVSSAGSYASAIALSFGILDAGSPADLAVVFLAREIPIVALVLAGGVFADRFPRRLVLSGCAFVQAVSQLAAAAVLLSGSVSTPLLAALAVANGAAAAFRRPAEAGLVPQVVSPGRLQQANALLGVTPRAIGIAGSALGAGLIEAVGAGWALAFDSLTYLVAGLLMLSVARGTAPPRRTSSPLADFTEGWREVRSRRWLWTMILSFGAFQVSYFPAVLVLGPEIAREHLGGAPAWAAIVSGGVVGGLLGGVVASHVLARRPLVLMCLVALPITVEVTALALVWPTAVVVAAAALGGAGLTVSDSLWFTTLQRTIPDESLSRVSSFDWLGSVALNPLGYLLIAPLAAAFGTRATMGVAAALLGLASVLPLLVRPVRDLRMPEPEPEVASGPAARADPEAEPAAG